MESLRVKISLLLLVSFWGLVLLGCGGEPVPKKEDIQGKWLAIERDPGIPGRTGQVGFMIEFFNDNTVMLPSGKRNWSILNDGRVKIEDPGLIMYGSLKENILTITMPNETKVIFKKQ